MQFSHDFRSADEYDQIIMLQELFEQQRRQLDYFYQHLDIQKCQVFVQKLLEVKGHIFFSGVGKSGLIAQKITTTLMSTGTKRFFYHQLRPYMVTWGLYLRKILLS